MFIGSPRDARNMPPANVAWNSGTRPWLIWASRVALLYAGVSLFALTVHRLATNSAYPLAWRRVGATLVNQNIREEWEAIAIAVGVVLAFAVPRMGRGSF